VIDVGDSNIAEAEDQQVRTNVKSVGDGQRTRDPVFRDPKNPPSDAKRLIIDGCAKNGYPLQNLK